MMKVSCPVAKEAQHWRGCMEAGGREAAGMVRRLATLRKVRARFFTAKQSEPHQKLLAEAPIFSLQ